MLVIGYGNPLRADDRVGWVVADAVRRVMPGVSVRTTQTLTPELTDAMAQSDLVVFVDARTGADPGRVDVERVHACDRDPVSPHGLTPATLLAWTARLHGRHPQAWLVSVVGQRYEFDDSLSASVEHSIATVVETIVTLRERDRISPAS